MYNMIVWAAGFMDGEGTITIKRSKYYRNKSLIYYVPYISCTQTVRGKTAIYKLQEIFGGSVSNWSPKGNRLDTISWNVTSRKAENVAKKLLPYLLLKKKQAEIIIRFYKEYILHRENQYTFTEQNYKDRENLFMEMRRLNVKGKLHLQRLNEAAVKTDVKV